MERFVAERWPITTVVIESPAEVADLGLPWYSGSDRLTRREFDEADAKRIYIREVADLLETALAGNRADDIRERLTFFEAAPEPPTVIAPCYQAEGRPRILLDRCHRCSALVLGGIGAQVELVVIEGPDDPDCLADLLASDS
jgi:hypothetical protein